MHILTANWDKPDFNSTLFSKFAGAAVQCRGSTTTTPSLSHNSPILVSQFVAFTDDQLDQLLSFIDTNSSSAGDSESLPEPDQQQQQLGQRDDVVIVCSPVLESRTVYDALAAEYGLNPDVVKALSARLSGV